MLETMETKFEDEFNQINDAMSRKASAEDLTYFRKEQAFKSDKEEVEDLRREFFERISTV